MKEREIYFILIIFFITAFLTAKTFNFGELDDTIKYTLTSISFVFGVILAFSIANRQRRLEVIRQKLREQDAVILDIYNLAKIFDNNVLKSIREKLDNLLISQLDYKLRDFDKSSKEEMNELYEIIKNINTKNSLQNDVKNRILFDRLRELLRIQKEVNYQINNKMLSIEWASLILFGSIIIVYLLFYFNNGRLFSIITLAFIATGYFLLLLILYEFDGLRWQENNWIWVPITRLFIELDLIPYYPALLIKQKKVNLEEIKDITNKIRLVNYPNFYPNFSGKKVQIKII